MSQNVLHFLHSAPGAARRPLARGPAKMQCSGSALMAHLRPQVWLKRKPPGASEATTRISHGLQLLRSTEVPMLSHKHEPASPQSVTLAISLSQSVCTHTLIIRVHNTKLYTQRRQTRKHGGSASRLHNRVLDNSTMIQER